MALTEKQKSQLVELAQSEGYKLLKERFNKLIQIELSNFHKRTFKDLSEITSLQERIKVIGEVFSFVEQSKGE